MTSFLLSGPALEPVTLVQAKQFIRVSDTAEDSFITTLITAARLHVEGVTGRALIAQSWRVICDDWPHDRIVVLPLSPMISLTAITAYDENGTPVSLAMAQFQPETKVTPARIFLPSPVAGSPVLREHSGIEIDYVAGYGSAQSDIPADLVQAVLSLVGYWFENRDAVVIAGSGSVVPSGFDKMISRFKSVGL